MKTKVCYVVESSAGGVLIVIQDSIKKLLSAFESDFEFTIIYSIRADTPTDFEQLFSGVNFIRLQMGSKAFDKSDFSTVIKLRSLLSECDVVHFHSSRAGFLGRIALATMFKKPVAFYSPHAFAFLNLEFSKFKRNTIWFIEFVLAKLSGCAYIACGSSEYKLALKIYKKTFLITNGIPLIDHDSQEGIKTEKNCKFNVVGSGRNCTQKNPSLFIDIAKNSSSKDFLFTWIGDLDREYSKYATGWVSRHEVFNHLFTCQIFLATSLWEGLPVNGIEAMMLGKPLLVYDCSSYVDLVEHGINGYIFSTDDEAVSYLIKLKKDSSLRNQMSKKSREIALRKFTDNNYLKLRDLYIKGLKVPPVLHTSN